MMDGWMVGWLNDRWRNRRETETEEFLTDALMCGLLIVCSVFSRLLNLDSSALERFSHKSSSPPATAPFMLLIVFSRISDTSLFRNYYHFMCMGILLHFYVLGFFCCFIKPFIPFYYFKFTVEIWSLASLSSDVEHISKDLHLQRSLSGIPVVCFWVHFLSRFSLMSSRLSVYLLIFDCVLEINSELLFQMSLRVYIRETEQWGGREEQGFPLSSERPSEKHASEKATCSKALRSQGSGSNTRKVVREATGWSMRENISLVKQGRQWGRRWSLLGQTGHVSSPELAPNHEKLLETGWRVNWSGWLFSTGARGNGGILDWRQRAGNWGCRCSEGSHMTWRLTDTRGSWRDRQVSANSETTCGGWLKLNAA